MKIIFGNIDVSFTNYFLVSATLTTNNFVIKNAQTDETIIQNTSSVPVAPNSSKHVTVAIDSRWKF